MKHSSTQTATEQCPYCEGTGYFQLLLGGSETCNKCNGEGQEQQA
ncbi:MULTISPECIES: YuiA family protein [Halalkalibacter]|uniref:YuiA family protein n=1 Tax=Halalkalibacter alkaliphilus TaxID=2917993 RepID=A0A9X2I6H9_9BACI|nr:YuiA family protein [Halalkalibacter alkaliphilus]MCL7748912.1 YuiA family protein [Halalkalibacter alkaliphilus]